MNRSEHEILTILKMVDTAMFCSDPVELDRVCYFVVEAMRHKDMVDAKPVSRGLLKVALVKLQGHRREVYEAIR